MYTNGTTNYNLPQYIDSDKASWTDFNAPFSAIDTAIKSAVDNVDLEAQQIDTLKTRVTAAESNIADNAASIIDLDSRTTTAEGAIARQTAEISDVRQDSEDMICAYSEASAVSTHSYIKGDYFIYNNVLYRATAQIGTGDTIVPDLNCTTTNVTSELMRSPIVRASADGIKTLGDILNEIYNGAVGKDLTNRKLIIDYGNASSIFNIVDFSATSIRFSQIGIGNRTREHVTTIYELYPNASIAAQSRVIYDDSAINSVSFAYLTSTIPSSGVLYIVQ